MMFADYEKEAAIDTTAENQEQAMDLTAQEIERLKAEVGGLKEKLMRERADFDNAAKRMEKDRAQWTRISQQAMLLEMIALQDDFDRAFEQRHGVSEAQEAWLAGFKMIEKSLTKFLTKHNVVPMTAYTSFDPMMHEAIAQVESAEHASGDIVGVLQKGYMLGKEVLRPAKVSVAK